MEAAVSASVQMRDKIVALNAVERAAQKADKVIQKYPGPGSILASTFGTNFEISISDSATDASTRDIPHRAAAGPQEATGPQGGSRR